MRKGAKFTVCHNETTPSWMINGLKMKSKGKSKNILRQNGNIAYQNVLFFFFKENVWDSTKAVLRGKFITIKGYTKKRKKKKNLK